MTNQTIQNRFENYIRLQNKIFEYEHGNYTAYIPSVGWGTAVQSGGVSDRTATLAIDNAELRRQYANDKAEIEKLNRYIEAINSTEVKEICVLKYCRGWSWEHIAKRVHCDRTTVSKKIKRFFRKFPTIPA